MFKVLLKSDRITRASLFLQLTYCNHFYNIVLLISSVLVLLGFPTSAVRLTSAVSICTLGSKVSARIFINILSFSVCRRVTK